MPDTDAPASPGPQEDVVDLLLAQHAEIERLFLLVIGGTGDIRRDALLIWQGSGLRLPGVTGASYAEICGRCR
ncbi:MULTISPECIES: hypothetical protein [unclassified Micromonospora]|uniref:hypothetical protein n=1 Tax=unclassified Micromonospora TaxID=2617518 RepID=UPI001B38BA78|nr:MULTISPECIES: hypothetical protein [unclassified Micromonospora]MBQ1041527.1 hypothetical protein [Micromonospora sp. C72]MBQ1053428.1 hypothetical protein [Micromonospora sp. C32]